MWILLDNYDSFTYILHDYLLQTGNECSVYRNDEITIEELQRQNPSRLIISPGPETPLQAGICMDAIKAFHDQIPILGVCLGHQALGMFFGAKLQHAPYPMHGKTSDIVHTGNNIFKDINSPLTVMRYHSLVIDQLEHTGLTVTAHTQEDGCIMAIEHTRFPCTGIQFHPESVGTPQGLQLLKNWTDLY